MRVVQKALTFDDVLLIPAHSTVLPRDVSLTTRLTRGITLNNPQVSAAMDTVTEARLAIAQSQLRGAESSLIGSRERYIRVVGTPPGNLATPPALPNLPVGPDQAVSVALEDNPTLDAAKNTVTDAKATIQGGLYPNNPDATVNYGLLDTLVESSKTPPESVYQLVKDV